MLQVSHIGKIEENTRILTENIVAKNTPIKLTMAQKKSVIVFSRQMDRLDFTTPKDKDTRIHSEFPKAQGIQVKE